MNKTMTRVTLLGLLVGAVALVGCGGYSSGTVYAEYPVGYDSYYDDYYYGGTYAYPRYRTYTTYRYPVYVGGSWHYGGRTYDRYPHKVYRYDRGYRHAPRAHYYRDYRAPAKRYYRGDYRAPARRYYRDHRIPARRHYRR